MLCSWVPAFRFAPAGMTQIALNQNAALSCPESNGGSSTHSFFHARLFSSLSNAIVFQRGEGVHARGIVIALGHSACFVETPD
jgi:hypothetical protein